MSQPLTTAQILREAYDDGCRRCAADLERFARPLDAWIDRLVQRRLPRDWRERMHEYLTAQEPKGYTVERRNRWVVEEEILHIATERGLLPEPRHDGIQQAFEDAYDSSVEDSPVSNFVAQMPGDEPVLVAPGDYSQIGEAGRALERMRGFEKFKSDQFWTGRIILAEANGLPTGILKWNSINGITVKPTAGHARFNGWGTVYLLNQDIARAERIANAKAANPSKTSKDQATTMGLSYEEGFRALYAWTKPNWFKRLLASQEYTFYRTSAMAEEAASELIGRIIGALARNAKNRFRPNPTESNVPRDIPTYEYAKRSSYWSEYLTPRHTEPEQKYEDDSTADDPMSESLYYATLWLLYEGPQAPWTPPVIRVTDHFFPRVVEVAPASPAGVPNELAALKKWWAQKFRPNWTPQQVNTFIDK